MHDLYVRYSASQALQGVDIQLDHGIHAILGRNGMGKTTLCNAIMGLVPAHQGSIRFAGRELIGLPSNEIAAAGIGYTPQGRRLWPSLTVDEHLQLCKVSDEWSVERIYEVFPALAQRRRHGGANLSGGEQQMLAIARSLLQNPKLLVLDEPTEGLAPVIVEQLEQLMQMLVAEKKVAILLVEQNISVACAAAQDVAIMLNGKIAVVLPSSRLTGDRTLQQQLLGVGKHTEISEDEFASLLAEVSDPSHADPAAAALEADIEPSSDESSESNESDETDDAKPNGSYAAAERWSATKWNSTDKRPEPRAAAHAAHPSFAQANAARPRSLANDTGEVLVAGTFDTKGRELEFIRDCLRGQKLTVRTVDLSTSGKPSGADIPPHHIAASHPNGANAVFTDDRGSAVKEMATAFAAWITRRDNVAGIISAAGSGGTALATPAMQKLPVGVPKVMISTVASGDVGEYVGPADIMMMYSVTDVQGINQISHSVLSNGAAALAGMVVSRRNSTAHQADKASIGLTMFGVTTSAVQQITAQLESSYDCLVFHATGTGGRSMEKLADSALLAGAIDLTTTEICDMLCGGVFAADEDRFGSFIRTKIPYVGSVGALDMVNFGARDTVPDKYSDRLFYEHNPQVTLMRTTAEENARFGSWIADRLNRMQGPVRFLLPTGGVSALDAPDQPFWDPKADQALFDALTAAFEPAANRRLVTVAHHINSAEFCTAAVEALHEVLPVSSTTYRSSYAAI